MKPIKWTQVVSWLASLSLVLTAVTPVLPPTAPEWLRQALVLVAVTLAALTHSPRADGGVS